MTAFEDFVNAELPVRVSSQIEPTADNYPRFLGFAGAGLGVEERTPAEVLADIGAQASASAVTAAATLTADVIPVGDGARGLADNTGGVTLVGTTLAKLTQIDGANGEVLAAFESISASAVNYLRWSNHITGNDPILQGFGTDADVGIFFSATGAGIFTLSANSALVLPIGTTAQRPGSPINGMVRYDSDTDLIEGRQAGEWLALAKQGDVVGPASATNLALATFDGTTGKLIQSNTATLLAASLRGLSSIYIQGDIFNNLHGVRVLAFTSSSGAVNFVTIANATTGIGCRIFPGSTADDNVDMIVQSRGTGTIELEDDTNIDGNLGVTGTVDGVDVAAHDHDGTAEGGVQLDPTTALSAVVPHELGGIETDISAVIIGGLAVGTGVGAMGLLSTAAASDGDVLTVQGDKSLAYETPSGGPGGSGDVVGPGSATNNAFARFDTTTGKLIQDSKLLGADVGVSGSPTDLLTLVNDVSGTVDTETSILFRQKDSGATLRDAGRITMGVEEAWTATATTRDSFMAFHTSFDGTVSEAMRVHSGRDDAGNNAGSILGVNTGANLGDVLNFPGLDVRADGKGCMVLCYTANNTAGSGATIQFVRARGSLSSKSAIQNGDILGSCSGRGWTGSAWRSPTRFQMNVDGTVTSTLVPMDFSIATGSSGSGTTRFMIRAAGGIEIAGTQVMSFNGVTSTIQSTSVNFLTIASPVLDLYSTSSFNIKIGSTPQIVFNATPSVTSIRANGVTRFECNPTGLAFNGNTPIARPTYTVTNLTESRTISAATITHLELAQVVGTLLRDLQDYGLLQ